MMRCVIYKKGEARGENDEYIVQGSEALLKACTSK